MCLHWLLDCCYFVRDVDSDCVAVIIICIVIISSASAPLASCLHCQPGSRSGRPQSAWIADPSRGAVQFVLGAQHRCQRRCETSTGRLQTCLTLNHAVTEWLRHGSFVFVLAGCMQAEWRLQGSSGRDRGQSQGNGLGMLCAQKI